MTLLVRERAPLRLHAIIETPSGAVRRWAHDEPRPENVLGDSSFSSTAPGGFEQGSSQLARRLVDAFPDLEELSTVTFYGAGDEIAWEGRLKGSPRSWGQQSTVQPQLVGYQDHLDDDQSAREIYVDVDRSRWIAASVQRNIDLGGVAVDDDDASSSADLDTGFPSVVTAFTGAWARAHRCEAWYDANGIDIGQLYYAWKLGDPSPPAPTPPPIDPTDTNWEWDAFLSSDDVASSLDTTGNLRAAGPGSGMLMASAAGRKWAMLMLAYAVAAGADGQNYPVFWTCSAVYGRHGLPLQGSGDAANAPGVLASDMIAHAVGKWARLLTFTTGPDGTIQPSSFVIPHLPFYDPTTAGNIVKAATAFELLDWFVWEHRTFWCHQRGMFGRNWRARVGDVQLQETGPSSDRLYNGAIVTFTDVSGNSRSVGPPGSGCNVEDISLLDPDPQNPATELGIARYSPPIQLGTGTADIAIKAGQVFLQEQKLLDTSGQATLSGHVRDDHGVLWPAWKPRAGDTLTIEDASDPSPRRIVRPEYSDSQKTCTVSLDAPPDGMQELLARLGAESTPIGI